MRTRRVAMIDGDLIAYEATCSCQREDRDRHGDVTRWVDAAQLRTELRVRMKDFAKKTGADRLVVALSDRHRRSWRAKILRQYKEDRKADKPVGYWRCVEELRHGWPCVEVPWLEADDVVGLIHTRSRVGVETVAVSSDKDFRTLPGLLYDPRHDKLERMSRRDADRNHAWQALVGDTADGFPGCPGVGKGRAAGVLEAATIEDAWRFVVGWFEKKELTEIEAIRQAQVARILRCGDFSMGRVGARIRLWRPPCGLWTRPPGDRWLRLRGADWPGRLTGSALTLSRATTSIG